MNKITRIIDEYERGFWSREEFKREFIKEIQARDLEDTIKKLKKLKDALVQTQHRHA